MKIFKFIISFLVSLFVLVVLYDLISSQFASKRSLTNQQVQAENQRFIDSFPAEKRVEDLVKRLSNQVVIGSAPIDNKPDTEKPAVIKHALSVEFALTLQQIRTGLMHRDSLANDMGMLFWFPENDERKFWMKNTRIPLDIIFIHENGVINHIHHNAIPFDETLIPSNGKVRAVIEIPGGLAREKQIVKGDIVYHDLFSQN